MRLSRLPFIVGALVAPLFASTPFAAAQGAAPAEGVYSAAQAKRGRVIVENHCTACHGDDLAGLEGPALVGGNFMLNWEPRDVGALFRKIRDTMPTGAITSVTDDEKLDTVAYLLQQNGFSAGAAELTHDLDALARIRMSRDAGPIALRTGSFIRVTGCLAQDDGKAWRLTGATEPQPAAASPQKPVESTSAGNHTVELLNVFPEPSAHKSHQVVVSGLLVQKDSTLSVNVMSLEMISSTCER
jgi:mono/diheme cytochrome c family protein